MDDGEKLLWGFGFGAVGILLIVGVAGFFYTDLWLNQIDGKADTLATAFDEDYRESKNMMQELRPLMILLSVATAGAFAFLSHAYYEKLDDPGSSIGLSLAGSVVFLSFGGLLYLGSQNIGEEAISSGLLATGGYMLLLNAGFLAVHSDSSTTDSIPARATREQSASQPPPQGSSGSYSFCPACGVEIGEGHRFCTNCGEEIPER